MLPVLRNLCAIPDFIINRTFCEDVPLFSFCPFPFDQMPRSYMRLATLIPASLEDSVPSLSDSHQLQLTHFIFTHEHFEKEE